MKKYLLLIIAVCCNMLSFSLQAQPIPPLFQAYGWEQACLQAVRENKLVLVQIGTVDAKTDRGVQSHRELMNYLHRNLIAIRIDANSPEAKELLPRLLMYEPPLYAFFMPYGDLLESLTPGEVAKNPEALREALTRASELAAIKKSNSRSILFANEELKSLREKARKDEKLIFAYVRFDNCQPGLLMEKNVFNLNRVADFYNRNFISIVLSENHAEGYIRQYKPDNKPLFLFLNADGKVVYHSQGYHTAEQLVESGKVALEKAAGIAFRKLSEEEAGALAQKEGKLIFTDHYTPGNAHNEMVRNVFTDPDVAEFFNRHFINRLADSSVSRLTFTDPSGREIHRVLVVSDAQDLLHQGKRVVAGKGLLNMDELYGRGERTSEYLQDYITLLGRAGRVQDASVAAEEYLSLLPLDCLKEEKYWNVFNQYVRNVNSPLFSYVLSHRKELYGLYGEIPVRRKIGEIWVVGAEEFVKDGKFDELGFKAYTKRLKQEKVEGWREILRNARMHAAEKTGDWRTYVELAEEKWNEEQIGDAELYSWGVIINRECRDEAIRYKAARWFAESAIAKEQEARKSGKVKVSSYKGFFEKLVDDLVNKKAGF